MRSDGPEIYAILWSLAFPSRPPFHPEFPMMRFPALVSALLVSLPAFAADDAGFKPLFNGRDLTGWEGLAEVFSVKDGLIHAETTAANPLKKNTFLIYTAQAFADFELRFDYRVVGGLACNTAASGCRISCSKATRATSRTRIVSPGCSSRKMAGCSWRIRVST